MSTPTRALSEAEKKRREVRDQERESDDLAFWESLQIGSEVTVGTVVMTVEKITPTHVFAGDRRWKPADIGLGRRASIIIRDRGEEERKRAVIEKGHSWPKKKEATG